MKHYLILLILLFPGIAEAELSVSIKQAKAEITTVKTERIQVKTEDGIPIGNPRIKEGEPEVSSGKPVVILFVKTDRPIGELLVKPKSDTCNPYLVEPGVYAISDPGTHRVDVNVIGQNPLSWEDKTVTFTVGDDPGPEPGPDPVPPTPDNGDFDGLQTKVRNYAKFLPAEDRRQIASILDVAADKMRSFEFRQIKQAQDYITRNWPQCKSENCGKIWKLVYDDSTKRSLSWEETQSYYRTVAKGMN